LNGVDGSFQTMPIFFVKTTENSQHFSVEKPP